jgi:hypothetical protein
MESSKPKPAMKRTVLIALAIVIALVVVGLGAGYIWLSGNGLGNGSGNKSPGGGSDGTGAGPAAVNLRSAGNFVVLAKTGISATGTTHVTGDIGVSPAAATYITGFGLVADASNQFSTSSLVTGKVYAANYAVPTPATMTAAIKDMQTAYTDAAGRTKPDHVALGAGDVTSMTLKPGLYKWSTGLLISAAGVTLSGNASDVWIFQIAGALTLANGAHITLSGGALASHVFWQVASGVTIGTTAVMNGVVLSQTAIVMNAGATLNGRALAQTDVTMSSSIVKT